MATTLSDVVQTLVTLVQSNWEDLGLNRAEDVYYGDQTKIPYTPTITVEGVSTQRELSSTGMIATVIFSVYIFIYHSPIISPTQSRRETDIFTENVVSLLHKNKKLGGLLIHSLVAADEVGVADRAGTLMRTTRLQWQGQTRESVWE